MRVGGRGGVGLRWGCGRSLRLEVAVSRLVSSRCLCDARRVSRMFGLTSCPSPPRAHPDLVSSVLRLLRSRDVDAQGWLLYHLRGRDQNALLELRQGRHRHLLLLACACLRIRSWCVLFLFFTARNGIDIALRSSGHCIASSALLAKRTHLHVSGQLSLAQRVDMLSTTSTRRQVHTPKGRSCRASTITEQLRDEAGLPAHCHVVRFPSLSVVSPLLTPLARSLRSYTPPSPLMSGAVQSR